MKDLKNIQKQLEPITKSIYFKIFVIVLIVIIAWVIVRKIRASFERSDDYSRESGDYVNRKNLTYTNLEYMNFTNRLFDAMKGPGTNEDIVFEVLNKLRTADDWYKLVEVFGVRKVSTGPFSEWSGNLMNWLTDELNEDEQAELGEILNKLGIEY